MSVTDSAEKRPLERGVKGARFGRISSFIGLALACNGLALALIEAIVVLSRGPDSPLEYVIMKLSMTFTLVSVICCVLGAVFCIAGCIAASSRRVCILGLAMSVLVGGFYILCEFVPPADPVGLDLELDESTERRIERAELEGAASDGGDALDAGF